MAQLIFLALSPVIFGITAILLLNFKVPVNVQKYKKNKKLIPVHAVMIMCILSGIIMLTWIIISKSAYTEKNIPISAALLLSGIAFSTFVLYVNHNKLLGLLKKILISVSVIFLCEIFIFNLKSFTGKKFQNEIPLESISLQGDCTFDQNGIRITANSSLVLNSIPELPRKQDSYGIILTFSQDDVEEWQPFNINVNMKDDNFSGYYQCVQNKVTNACNRDVTFTITPYGSIRSLRFDLSFVYRPITVTSIKITSALPFAFSQLRFFVLTAIASIVLCIMEFRLYQVIYDRKKLSHRIAVLLIALLCLSSIFVFLPHKIKHADYDPENINGGEEIYVQLFDALRKHQVYLDLEADPKLEELENVYDVSIRNESGAFARWDYAYFKGKYYCYFGVGPVITFYYPYYFITGKLPTFQTASLFLGYLTVIFFIMAFLSLIRLLVPKPNLLLMLLILPASLSSLGLFYAINTAYMYNVPIISGMCWLFLCLWMSFEAVLSKRNIPKIIFLFIAGTALVFSVASRPNMALSALVLAPFFIAILLDKTQKLSFRLTQAGTFLLPVMVGGVMLMLYNQARFGSPFDFGASYQLTVSDVHANKLRLTGFFPMLYHFFFQLPISRDSFPFFTDQFCVLYNYTSYAFLEAVVGAFFYPIITFGVISAFYPDCYREMKTKNDILKKRVFLIMCGCLSLMIGWADFCLGGATNRYVCDILPLLVMIAVTSILSINKTPGNSRKLPMRYGITIICCIVTICISGLFVVSFRDSLISKNSPDLYDTLEDILIFWQ